MARRAIFPGSATGYVNVGDPDIDLRPTVDILRQTQDKLLG